MNTRIATISLLFVLFALFAATPAAAQTAFFDDPTDVIQVDGQTVIGTASTYEAVVLFPSGVGAGGRLFNEWTGFQEDKLLRAGPTFVEGYNYPGSGTLYSAATVMPDVWHHVAFVYDGAEERLYLDGVLLASRPVSTSVGNGDGLAHVGAIFRDGSIHPGFVGYLESIRLSDVARYSDSTFTPPLGDLESDANTLLLFNFDEPADSPTVQDESPLGRTGTLATGFGGATAPLLGVSPTVCSFTVTTTADSGPGSLRQAILNANADPDTDTICFAIDGEGPHTIAPASELPEITEPVVIDGYTQPGASANTLAVGNDAVLMIELDGSEAGSAHGLVITGSADDTVVRGLQVNGFSFHGILIQGSSTVLVENVVIEGSVITGNGLGIQFGNGIELGFAADSRIGGPDAADRNVISGNLRTAGAQSNDGVRVGANYGSGLVTGTLIQNNYIGIDPAGNAAMPNANGIRVSHGAEATRVIGNVISGNLFKGIFLGGNPHPVNTTIQGNLIGVAADGTSPLGNDQGIAVNSTGDADAPIIIGGTEPGEGNVIAYNGGQGIILTHGDPGNPILGNSIYANGGLGIDLDGGGVTENDPGDADGGTNNLQNFPEIQSADYDEESGQIAVTYLVDTDPANATYPLRIEFFQADSDGQEGAAFLGSDSYAESDWDGCGAAPCAKTITFTPLAPVTRADHVLATATDDEGNTSEFSVPSQALPVELAAFEAAVDGQAVRLTWRTVSETGNAGFEVQRAEAGDGATGRRGGWETLAFVEGRGTTTEAQAYRFTDEGLPYEARRLVYRLKQIDGDGTFAYSREVEVDLSVPAAFALHGNFPNPFSGQTTIRYELPQAGPVRLAVYDLLGRRVAVLVDEAQEGGRKEVVFNASGLPSGVYFVRLQAGARVLTQRMAVVR